METIIISVCVGAFLFLIGLFCGMDANCTPEIYYGYGLDEIKLRKLGELETKVVILESENNRLNHIYENMKRDIRIFQEYMYSNCSFCGKNFYAKTPDGQDVADMLKNITLTSEQIANKLDIKIN